ncbi:MAG: sensor histidine kinase [Nitrospira sp.]|nr:sensor histidine kinase [Nitrospira sp.]
MKEIIHTVTHHRKHSAKPLSEKDAVARQKEDLRILAGKLLTVQDEERRRISRDLHDDVNQRLGAIGLQLDSLSHALPDSPSAIRKRIRAIRRRISEVSDDVRQLAYRFHQTTVEDLGLIAALQRYLNDFVKRTGVSVNFSKPRLLAPLPLQQATCLFRIAQECLGNVGVHAKATSVTVTLAVSPEKATLTIIDNGVGMDLALVRHRKAGLGMLSIQERARLLNGAVTWRSSPGSGTEVRARLPLRTEEP